MDTISLIHDLLPAMDLFQNRLRIFFCKRFQWIESFAELRQPYRNNRYALKYRCIFRHFLKAVFQFFSIIHTFAQNNLPIHGNSRFIKLIYLFQCFSCKTIMQHFAAKLRIHCLKRHIDRRKVIFDHTFNIFLTHIRQCNIISLQKRKPGIIILEIQCFSHAWRHLIDKAEHTVIAAGTVIIHQAILEFDSKIFIVILLNFKFPEFTIGFFYQKFYIFIIHEITIVKDILHQLVIDLCQYISRFQFQFLTDTSWKNPGNHMFLFLHINPF